MYFSTPPHTAVFLFSWDTSNLQTYPSHIHVHYNTDLFKILHPIKLSFHAQYNHSKRSPQLLPPHMNPNVWGTWEHNDPHYSPRRSEPGGPCTLTFSDTTLNHTAMSPQQCMKIVENHFTKSIT